MRQGGVRHFSSHTINKRVSEVRRERGIFAILLLLIASHGLVHGISAALPAVLPIIKSEFGLNYTEVGMISFSMGASLGIMGVFAGLLSDKSGDKLLEILGWSIFSSAVISIFAVFARNFLAVLLFFTLLGIFLSFYHPFSLSFIARAFKERRGRAFGTHEIGANLGLASAPALAGALAPSLGWRTFFAFLAVPAFLAAILILRTASRARMTEREGERERACVRRAGERGVFDPPPTQRNCCCWWCEFAVFLARLREQRSLLRLYLAECTFGFVVGGASTFIPLYLVAKGFGVALAGSLTGAFLAAGAVGKYLGGVLSDALGGKAIPLGFLFATPLFFVVPLLPNALAVPVLIIAGMTFPMSLSAIITGIGEQNTQRGLSFGFLMLAGFGFGSISRPILGIASDILGIHSIFFILALASLLGGLLNLSDISAKIHKNRTLQ